MRRKNMQDFSFTEDMREGMKCFYTLKGRISVNEATYIENVLNRAVQSGCNHMVINMSLVYMFSSAAIRVVLAMYKKLKNLGGELQIEAPSENVRNVIGMTALDELLIK